MERQSETIRSKESTLQTLHFYEQVFQSLPPLGSDEYVSYILSAPVSAIPPEVLARAFRQLPPQSDAAKRTFERLFRRHPDGSWGHLAPLVTYARRQSRKQKHDSYEDLLQDALRRILQILPTDRGEFAERSWNAFCRRELSDAWRERYGRRGERVPLEEPMEEQQDDEGSYIDPISSLSEAPPWHAGLKPNDVEAIETVLERVIGEIPDEFIKAIAKQAWLGQERPPLSGNRTTLHDQLPLTKAFPSKSRFQIMRALRHADSRLAAALLAERDLDLSSDVRTFLMTKLKVRKLSSTGDAKEQNK